MGWGKRVAAWGLGVLMVGAGIGHFADPAPFVDIVPPQLPAPLTLVYVSGVAEILGGLGLLLRRTRRAAAWGLVALFVAVFPANVYMAVAGVQPTGWPAMPEWALWGRLPLQALPLGWAWWLTRADPVVGESGRGV